MLTAAQLESFEHEGYLVVPDVLDDEVLAPIRAEYEALLDALYAGWQRDGLVEDVDGFEPKLKAAYAAGLDWFQPMDISLPFSKIEYDTPMHFSQPLLNMLTAPALLDIAESMVGPELTSNPIQHVRIKMPGNVVRADETSAHMGNTSWHQDRGVTHDEADQTDMVTVWIAVTDATEENGCLIAQPRSTTGNHLRDHCPVQNQPAIPASQLDEAATVSLPVNAGGIVLLHPMTPHAALPNVSDSIRWSFDIRYNVTGQPTGRSHFPDFIARSRAHPDREFRDGDAWRDMWKEARAQLAVQPHIPIHRWDGTDAACA
ncbi:phytanoyl-CoA dioxygenase family protein [Ahrensia sp. R2A130]|uniref:phytanoyl-CoA dioxygenase family protein n=1 Tax=Ahrensia sp. R2A130 TaxID=744979 RepID=UPI0001E0D127|nr:phytanoyl-CoA dioxygenase family protein [Ahrensia sp. R2A130]EFL87897.1 Phytanoyl-CoA dioxygenase superfamily protein [Ahrensia sp. R2A130]